MLHIAIGHQMDTFTYLLGNFASVSATTATLYPKSTIIGADGKPTGKTISAETPDHVAFTGILTSGAVSSITFRGGYSSTKGREQLTWIIDGEAGSIVLKSEQINGAFLNGYDPKIYLNGESVEVKSGKSAGFMGSLANAWAEYAKGESGEHATIEDAIRNHRLLDAIEKSAAEGRRVVLQ
jgi:predicted dehydrogenase